MIFLNFLFTMSDQPLKSNWYDDDQLELDTQAFSDQIITLDDAVGQSHVEDQGDCPVVVPNKELLQSQVADHAYEHPAVEQLTEAPGKFQKARKSTESRQTATIRTGIKQADASTEVQPVRAHRAPTSAKDDYKKLHLEFLREFELIPPIDVKVGEIPQDDVNILGERPVGESTWFLFYGFEEEYTASAIRKYILKPSTVLNRSKAIYAQYKPRAAYAVITVATIRYPATQELLTVRTRRITEHGRLKSCVVRVDAPLE